MKMTAAVCLFVVGMLGSEALAHGGGFRGSRGSVPPGLREPSDPPPPGIDCDCARPDCLECSHAQLQSGERLARNDIAQAATARWDDFATLRITATFRASGGRPIEAYALLAPSPVFAVTAGSIRQGGSELTAGLRTSQDARRRYLWAKRNGLDPLLVTRRNAGRYHLRSFPVRGDGDTVVVIDGFALAAPRVRGAPRLYRTGDRVLVVRDTNAPRDGEVADVESGRGLWFGTMSEVRARYGDRVDDAVEVPFVAAIETAITGEGDAAASDDIALVALEAGAESPPRVGPVKPEQDPAPSPPPPAQ